MFDAHSHTAGAMIAHVVPVLPTLPAAAGGSFTSYDGDSIGGTISGLTAHTWVDDAAGLFHTSTNLKNEWSDYYNQMVTGHGASLSPTQRLEAQAQALFQATNISHLSLPQQAVIREDVQREIDVIGAAMKIDQATLNIDPNAPLTVQSYIALTRAVAANPQLQELGVQGHGLNAPPLARYNGYTNDAQHTADSTTLYVGPGHDHNKSAVTDFMDDAIMTHIIFPVVMKQGKLVQLNQDGDREQSIDSAANMANRMLFGHLLQAKEFSATPKP